MINIPIINALGGMANFKTQFDQFKQTLPQNGFDPKQYKQQALMQAQQMLNSGQMTQQQYNNILQIAGMLSGENGMHG